MEKMEIALQESLQLAIHNREDIKLDYLDHEYMYFFFKKNIVLDKELFCIFFYNG